MAKERKKRSMKEQDMQKAKQDTSNKYKYIGNNNKYKLLKINN